MTEPVMPTSAFLVRVLNAPPEARLQHRVFVEHALGYLSAQPDEIRRYQAVLLRRQIARAHANGTAAAADLAYGVARAAQAVERLSGTSSAELAQLGDEMIYLQATFETGMDRVLSAIQAQTRVLHDVLGWLRVPDSQKEFLHHRDFGRDRLRRALATPDEAMLERWLDDAWQELDQANRLWRFDPWLHLDLGFLAFWHLDDLDLALAHFREVAPNAPDEPRLQALGWRHLAGAHYRRWVLADGAQPGEIRFAYEAAVVAHRLAPDDREAELELARYAGLAGESDEALKRLRRVLKTDRGYAVAVTAEPDLAGQQEHVQAMLRRLRDRCLTLAEDRERKAAAAEAKLERLRERESLRLADDLERLRDACGKLLEDPAT